MVPMPPQASVTPAVAASCIAFVEGSVFKGSRRMPLDDLLTAFPDDAKAPGMAAAHAIAFRKALHKERPTQAHVPTGADAGHGTSPVGDVIA